MEKENKNDYPSKENHHQVVETKQKWMKVDGHRIEWVVNESIGYERNWWVITPFLFFSFTFPCIAASSFISVGKRPFFGSGTLSSMGMVWLDASPYFHIISNSLSELPCNYFFVFFISFHACIILICGVFLGQKV